MVKVKSSINFSRAVNFEIGRLEFDQKGIAEVESRDDAEKIVADFPETLMILEEEGDGGKVDNEGGEGEEDLKVPDQTEREQLFSALDESKVVELKELCKEAGAEEKDYKSLNKGDLINFIIDNEFYK